MEKIIKALNTLYGESVVKAGQVFRGHGYDGHVQRHGWYFSKFDNGLIFLGFTVTEALETIENIKASRETI